LIKGEKGDYALKMKKRLLALGLSLVLATGMLTVPTVDGQAAVTVAETEDNNNRNQANVIDVNTTVDGNVAGNDEEDWYTFTLPSDGYFSYNLSSFGTHNIALYDSSLNKLSSGKGTVMNSQRYNYAKGTVFFVEVSFAPYYANNTADYELTINHTPTTSWEIETNNSRKTAEKLSKKMKGTMISSSDVDWYKYTASDSGYVKFKFINEDGVVTNYGWKITVYSKDLSELASWNVKADITIGTFTVKAKEVLYIKINCESEYFGGVQDCVYSIAPVLKATQYVEKEDNNSFKKATTIKSGKKYIGVLNYSKDEDYYKFVAPSSATYRISFECVDEVKYGYNVTIYNSSKEELKKLSNLTDDSSAKIKMKKGKTYYIHVANGNSWASSWAAKYKIKVSKVK
jgi:hypothetical protein